MKIKKKKVKKVIRYLDNPVTSALMHAAGTFISFKLMELLAGKFPGVNRILNDLLDELQDNLAQSQKKINREARS